MTITTAKAAGVVRFLRSTFDRRRVRRVMAYLRSLIHNPAGELDRFLTRQGLSLSGRVKRLDHRGPAASVIRQRRAIINAMLRGEGAA